MPQASARAHIIVRSAAGAAVALLLAIGVLAFGGASPARAADPSTTITSASFETTTFRDQSVQTLAVSWKATA